MRPLELLPGTTAELIRAVDALHDEELAAPSRLPGWTRAHVVAHLALNAEGLSRVLEARSHGEEAAQYDSDASRDDDIERLATAGPRVLRDRLMASSAVLRDDLVALAPEDWEAVGHRTPDGMRFPLRSVPLKRLVEVAVHHVDLGTGHEREHWSDDLAAALVDALASRTAGRIRLHAHDLDRTWGEDEAPQTVGGRARDLAWWLSGRGSGEGLESDNGAVPALPGW